MRLILSAFAALTLATLTLAVPANAQDLPESGPGSVAWANQQQAALHAPVAADGWTTLEGGVKWRRIAGDGTGSAPKLRDQVTVHYTGRLADGTVFDTSEGRDPATFPLNRLIRAWQIGIPYMGVGDTVELVVPMEMGYGMRGGGPIPGGATLFFTVSLLDVIPNAR